MSRDPYPSIGEYAFLSDCHSVALVSRAGSIDWCCMPRLDVGSMFGRILDWERGGFCWIRPTADHEIQRNYVDDSLVLETQFRTRGAEGRLFDCFAMRRGGATEPRQQLLRILEVTRGQMRVQVEVCPRFDYGEVRPWVRRHAPGIFTAIGGNDAILVQCDHELARMHEHDIAGTVSIEAGERLRLAITSYKPEEIDVDIPRRERATELDRRLDETIAWWHAWARNIARRDVAEAAGARRSAIVLKALTYAPTGAVAAAPTTSLPERVGGTRNWDYRFTWIRDSHFTVRSLAEIGAEDEADGFRRFVERSAAGSAESLQIMYGVGGERRLTEIELDLDGYRGSRPVRVGNGAATQHQFDVYGELLDLAWRWHERGQSPDDDYWRFLCSLVNRAAEIWTQPDAGMWEMRGKPRHFVQSKAMCWVALQRGLDLARESMRRAPTRKWRAARDELRATIDRRGYSKKMGTFVQAFGSTELDASLLLLPAFDFVPWDDERMVRTVDAIGERLTRDGLVLRYSTESGLDGVGGGEAPFVACTFWYAECLAHQGRIDRAREAFDRAMAASNDLGLFSEEYDPRTGELLGNFPQGLTHLSHLTAALAIVDASHPEYAADRASRT
ncbi:MAG TPA: glycoside hydrolase family 15 protein [Acidimicrobiia bacterium]|nr:glycoside hydrolase family 15 protein [Acidimicrobiia bacterium]